MKRMLAVVLGIALLTGAGACGKTGTKKITRPQGSPSITTALPTFGPGASYHPTIDPKDFTANVDNPWFPLTVGTTLVYTGTKDGEKARELFTTTAQTKVIAGVTTRVVEDKLYLNDRLEEYTLDYYTQDKAGNVWYFGEDTYSIGKNGKRNPAGTWHAGVDGAEPGVFMQAEPEIGREFRQEYYKGEAEDQFKVVDQSSRVTVPQGSYDMAMRTEEKTTLEPEILDNKFYVRGIGTVMEIQVKGPPPIEKLELVEIKRA